MSASLRHDDPILFQVLNSAFASITDEMGALVRRAAFSLVVSEGADYSGTISNRNGDLVASGVTDLAAHLGTIPFTVKGTLDWIAMPAEEFFRPGDVVLINDPYIGGTHHNDMRAIMPVYLDGRAGRLRPELRPLDRHRRARPGHLRPQCAILVRRGPCRASCAHRARGRVPVGDGGHHPAQHPPGDPGAGRSADPDRSRPAGRAAPPGARRAVHGRDHTVSHGRAHRLLRAAAARRVPAGCPMAPGTSRR